MKAIYEFHEHAKVPTFDKLQNRKHFMSKCGEFFIKDSRLFKKNGTKPPLLVVMDPEHKYSILQHVHDKLGHRGIFSVTGVIQAQFFWPNMQKDNYHHIKSCHECQIRSLKRLEIPLTISAPVALFAKIYVNIMHMPPAHGFKYIVAAKDDLSSTSEAKALRHATAEELQQFFYKYIYCQYGAPLLVVTDNGPEVKKGFQLMTK